MQVPARLVVALLTLLALVLSGCGGGDGSSTSPGTATLLADAFGAGKPTRSGRIDLTLDVRARGLPNLKGPLVVRVTGPFQSTGAGRAPKFAFDLGLTSGAAMRRVLGGNQRYTRCLQEADADLARAQACAGLVGQ